LDIPPQRQLSLSNQPFPAVSSYSDLDLFSFDRQTKTKCRGPYQSTTVKMSQNPIQKQVTGNHTDYQPQASDLLATTASTHIPGATAQQPSKQPHKIPPVIYADVTIPKGVIPKYIVYSKEAENMEYSMWASAKVMCSVLAGLATKNYSSQVVRGSALCDIASFQMDAPFNEYIRFPGSGKYVCLSVCAISSLLQQLTASLMLKDFNVISGESSVSSSVVSKDIRVARAPTTYSDAVTAYNHSINGLRVALSTGIGSYNRSEFEEKFSCVWGKPGDTNSVRVNGVRLVSSNYQESPIYVDSTANY